ncbi:TIGR04083 family peptide-modifying radical SAM enzyme [Fusibacter paucivorans]|uniref:TIGR04083 family peptide-modifying radical SAM enzyme n=1 Tax=Fusibacter paucivorans TaxID=76009 RepID=A0ABS5PQK7_9FIRM|nr:TIGR04083 family peptide-modifying radical SAM enzyme [Fusibacter paucivorans]MBS7526876.1 TIGR04083 family peptide-modifying radical SAM enzyme [Fusibacter paucivorans]
MCDTVFQNPTYMIVPSMKCQASCRYCFGPNIGKTMTLEAVDNTIQYIKMLSEMLEQQTVQIALHGGEPLCAGYTVIKALIKGLAAAFSGKDLKLSIQSNLWLLNDAYCELFKAYDVTVGTSLDGPKAISDAQRGEGYFEQTMRGIQKLKEAGIKHGVIATFTKQSLNEWETVRSFFQMHQMPFDCHGAVASPADARENAWHLSPEAYRQLFVAMIDDYENRTSEMKLPVIDQLCRGIYQGENALCTFRDCFGMFLIIDPMGDLYPCQRFVGHPMTKLGNIVDAPNAKTLSDSQAGALFLKRKEAIEQACAACTHLAYCRGGCAFNAMTNGNLLARDYLCEAYSAIFDHLDQLMMEELVSDVNINAILVEGASSEGNPFYREGTYLEIAKGKHPCINNG